MPSRRPPAGTLSLRVGSHNVRGLMVPGHFSTCLHLWRELCLDVVVVQEARATFFQVLKLCRQAKAWDYRCIHQLDSAGHLRMLVFYRHALCRAGRLIVHAPYNAQGGAQ